MNKLYYSFDSETSAYSPKLVEAFECKNPLNTDTGAISKAKSAYTLIRSAGEGEAVIRGVSLALTGEALIFADTKEVSRACCTDGDLFIFRFDCSGFLPFFEKNKVYFADLAYEEQELINKIFAENHADPKMNGAVKNALFTLLCSSLIKRLTENGEHKTQYHEMITELIHSFEESPEMQMSIGKMAKTLHLSERMFRKVFTAETGLSPKTFIEKLRLNKARQLLYDFSLSIGEISEQLGYSSQFRFSMCFKKEYGVSPSAYRKSI